MFVLGLQGSPRKKGNTNALLSAFLDQAEKLGADAVINVRFMTSAIMGGAAEILAYGTAVKLR